MAAGKSNKAVVIVFMSAGILACFAVGFVLMRGGGGEPETPAGTGPATAAAAEKAPPRVVYSADFTNPPGDEWNVHPPINYTPVGHRPNFGPFLTTDSPALTVKELPAHKLLRVTCDFFITMSWDGSSPIWGPTILDVSLDDDRRLLRATFCNCGFFSNNNEQTFPDNYPASPYPAFTMAAERQTLGNIQKFDNSQPDSADVSSVYHLVFTFPHDQPQVVVNFKSDIHDGGHFKGYGIANMRIEAIPELPTFTESQFKQMWVDLGSGIPETYYKARWDLVSAGNAAVDYIAKHAEEKIDLSAAQMKALAADIRSPDHDKSWAAFYQLKIQGPPAMSAMVPVLTGEVDEFFQLAPSQIQRYPLTATQTRLDRAKWVLEAINTPEARALKRALGQVGP
ncbi:MAG TPA: hypothetical protein VHM90_00580 [Phycisphaerae bacterium]|nr:hypothetical protein [Phycisphaerae bacterium]